MLIVLLILCEIVVTGSVVALSQSILTSILDDVAILLLVLFVVVIALILLVDNAMDHRHAVLVLLRHVLIVMVMASLTVVRIPIPLPHRTMTVMTLILQYSQAILKRVMQLTMTVMALSMKERCVLVLLTFAWIQLSVLYRCIVILLLVCFSLMDEVVYGQPILIGFLAPMFLHGLMFLLLVVA